MSDSNVGGRVVAALLIIGLLAGVIWIAIPGVDGPVDSAVAQDGDRADEEQEEGGLEGQIEGAVEGYGIWGAVLLLLAGGVILVFFVEKLISYLTRAATGLGVSVFSLAILFTGFEFDDTILALAFAEGGLENVALGTALGTALAIIGLTLAVAALVTPFRVTIPRDYLAILVVAPLVLFPLVILGTLTRIHGLLLIGLFAIFVVYVVAMEHRRDVPVFRDPELLDQDEADNGERNVQTDGGVTPGDRLEPIFEDRFVGNRPLAGYVWIVLAIVALAGVVAGAVLVETGSEVAIEETGLDQTIFGATVITLLLTFENMLLTLEPVRRGIPEIGIGHVIGSVVFSVTANIGFILLIADLTIGSTVLLFHFPALLLLTILGAYFVTTGQLKRWHGVVLGVLYVSYWAIAVLVLGDVPISG